VFNAALARTRAVWNTASEGDGGVDEREEGRAMVFSEETGVGLSRVFFEEVARPALARHCPQVLDVAACGRFGWGSECFGMDDSVSRDHHWGPRVDMLVPDDMMARLDGDVFRRFRDDMPETYRGFPLEPGHVGGPGLAPEGVNSFLMRTIGRTEPPGSPGDWLAMPEQDIAHVVNGELWHDGAGVFSAMRSTLEDYYPDEVWRRRMAHWCRHASGMGAYAVQRALLRDNPVYLLTARASAVKYTVELVFLLNRTYFPYEKWLYPLFLQLEALAPELAPLVDEAAAPDTTPRRSLELLESMHDRIDAYMVDGRLIPRHGAFGRSDTSGYRLLEWGYRHLLLSVPESLWRVVPCVQQGPMEAWVAEYVANLTDEEWRHMLVLQPED
jgi:hypothetical protein